MTRGASGQTGRAEAAAEAWKAVRADDTIQFAPLKTAPPPKPPSWLEALLRWLGEVLEPVGRALGMSWPVFKWVLLALAVAALVALVWRILRASSGQRTKRAVGQQVDDWMPLHADTLALLEDADALAARGQFDEATHLLLRRSVGQIAVARPGMVEPATTARELAALDTLPDAARAAFAMIATRVEQSLFALHPLNAEDWQAARAAYADFALSRLVARA